MKALKMKVRVQHDGRIELDDLPVKKGQEVEVVVLIEEQIEPTYPLRGRPVQYRDPFLPAVDESDCDPEDS